MTASRRTRGDEVDARLVRLAKAMRADIVTNDYNLNRVAEVQGVRVLNINELAEAVRIHVLARRRPDGHPYPRGSGTRSGDCLPRGWHDGRGRGRARLPQSSHRCGGHQRAAVGAG
jgi:hypothetical protein